MRAVLAVFVTLLVASSYAATFQFVGNVTLTAGEQETHKYRSTSFGQLDLGNLAYRSWFKSVNVGSTGVNGVTGDVLWGEMATGLAIVPAAYMSYWTGSAEITPNSTLDFSASNAFVGGAFLGLDEVDPNGNVVRSLPFVGTAVGLLGVAWNTEETDSNEGLNWVTVKGTQQGQPWELRVTFLMSDRVGIINKARTVVNPRSIESIVEIKNWNYQNNANKLVLKTAIASAAGSVEGNRKIITGTGLGRVYGTLQATAEISGSNANLEIKSSVSADLSGILSNVADIIKSIVQTKYGSNGQVAIFDVTFPAGAANIVWDPTFGQGDELSASNNNSASGLSIASFVLALAALLAVLF